MKKITSLLLAFILLFAMAGCAGGSGGGDVNKTPAPVLTESEKALAELQTKITEEGKLLGVAYLGFIDYDEEFDRLALAEQEHTKNLPFIADIEKYAENEGYHIYCIVPADDQVTVTVSKCEFDEEYMPCAGEEMIKLNQPFIVRGNVSDTMPNIFVTAQKGNDTIEYTPIQSGMDGSLVNSDNLIYDFTPYELM